MHNLATLRAGGYCDAGLTKLKLTEPLDSFPPEIFDASLAATLEILDLSGTGLSALPDDLGARLPRLRIAFFSGCKFKRFPSALAGCPRLEMVAFRKNDMEGFEGDALDDVALPPQLRWLILTDNSLTHIPSSIGRCARLEKCMLAGNCLTGLPDAMANCRNLTLLRLAANKLTALPMWLLTMPRLAFLSFAGNPCSASSPTKTNAAAARSSSTASSLPHVDWNQIEIHHVLGEGASGIISKGTIRSNEGNASGNYSRGPSSTLNSRGPSGFNTPSLSGTSTPALSVSGASVFSTSSSLSALSAVSAVSSTSTPTSTRHSLPLSPSTPVAVKIFRGALTSDGTPYDEMAACLAAGQHVNLVQVHGQIRWVEDADEAGNEGASTSSAPPAFRGGLIMELIPPQYRVLGQPPSFDSCTRDCFDSDDATGSKQLPVSAALAILSGVASAVAHLHARGIAHGDLYAHNILVARGGSGNGKEDKDTTHAILSDFGAATLYGSGSSQGESEANDLASLEKLEVLAFAHLVEDVLGLMSEDGSSSVRHGLLRLHAQCVVPAVADRPVFSTLVEELAAVQTGA
ncbi:serine/threonine protein kinase [Sporothrix schenckii ATCC 58251]|uniref:Serine/threonine protein kinase n=1 Tax=Sporothrix schenckii (strain ATCC 58251 / de Perez 2211183) TaxID=1391915 RepID=U7PP39_SPOS1|nr:serine/threonine protein kinase [Sporothrix schenckii ATCC 58251]